MKKLPDEDSYTTMDDRVPRRGEIPTIRDTDNPADPPENHDGDVVYAPEPDEWDEDAPFADNVI